MPPRRPKMAQYAPKTALRGLQKTDRPRFWWVLAAKRPQEASKTPQEAPKRAQDGPRWPQDAPKTPPRGPKDAPKTPQVRPKTALKLLPAPKTPQDTPKRVPRGPKMPPRRPKTPPRGPQDTPKTPNQVISEDIKNRGVFRCRGGGGPSPLEQAPSKQTTQSSMLQRILE